LLLFFDATKISIFHPVIQAAAKLTEKRNSLLQPKTKEFSSLPSLENRNGSDTPETSIEIVKNLDEIFMEFVALVPKASWLIPPRLQN